MDNQIQEIADMLLDAKNKGVGANFHLFVNIDDVPQEIIECLLSNDEGKRTAAIVLVGTKFIDQFVDTLRAASDVARSTPKVAPLKDFYPLDEDVPGGRHEVRLLRHMGKAVGRFVVPMDGEWSPPFDRVNVHYDRALAAYKQMLEDQNPH